MFISVFNEHTCQPVTSQHVLSQQFILCKFLRITLQLNEIACYCKWPVFLLPIHFKVTQTAHGSNDQWKFIDNTTTFHLMKSNNFI